MARIRTLKPEFWSNEALSTCSETTRLLAIALINLADDEGWFKAHPKLIQSFAFPYGEPSIKVSEMLLDLIRIKFISLFDDLDGIKFGVILNFSNHQVINKKTPSKIKNMLLTTGILPEYYGSSTGALPTGKEQGTGKGKERKEKIKKRKIEIFDEAWKVDFDKFWELYPRKIGRAKCEQKFFNLCKSGKVQSQTILDGLFKYLPVYQTKSKDFIPHPGTWLNQHRWADQIEETEIHPF